MLRIGRENIYFRRNRTYDTLPSELSLHYTSCGKIIIFVIVKLIKWEKTFNFTVEKEKRRCLGK